MRCFGKFKTIDYCRYCTPFEDVPFAVITELKPIIYSFTVMTFQIGSADHGRLSGLIKFSEINQGPSKVRKKIAIGRYKRLVGQGAIFKEYFSRVFWGVFTSIFYSDEAPFAGNSSATSCQKRQRRMNEKDEGKKRKRLLISTLNVLLFRL